MREQVGRLIFFDAVAEELLQLHPGSPPNTVALRTSGALRQAVEDDVSVAQAVARLCSDSSQDAPVRKFDELENTEIADTVVILAGGRTTRMVLTVLNAVRRPETVAVIIGYSENDASGLVELPYNPKSERAIVEAAARKLFAEAGIEFDPLAPGRVVDGGFKRLASDFDLFERSQIARWDDTPACVERFCHAVSRTWTYEGESINGDAVRAWVEQFRPSGFVAEACQLLAFLNREGFVTKRAVDLALKGLYERYGRDSGSDARVVSVQPPGKSEQLLAYSFRSVAACVPLEKVFPCLGTPGNPIRLLCIDDVIVSGGSMLKYLFEHNPSCGRLLEAALRDRVATLTILASHADERGIAAIRRDKRGFGGIDIKAATIIGDNRRVFDPLSVALADGARLVAFQEFCEELGTRLNPGNPLGWANAQWCVVLDYSVPNGTLPILWASSAGVDWHPLFGRSRKPVGRLNKERSKTVHPPA